MIVFVFLLFIFPHSAHAQEAAGEDTSGMRLTRDAPAAEEKPAEYVPSVPSPETTPIATPPEPKIVPLGDSGLYIDSTRILKFRILDKQTARNTEQEINEGGTITFGSLTIRLIECWHSAPDAKPESAALLQVFDGKSTPEFSGWMFASSPSLNPFEHPSYDIVVEECR